MYNDNSIKDNKEYTTKIYKAQNKETKETYYTYNVPNVGTEESANPYPNAMQEGEVVARAHTHGADPPVQAGSDNFSERDKSNASILNFDTYVATPNGALLKFDHNTEKESMVTGNIPSDENHHSRGGLSK